MGKAAKLLGTPFMPWQQYVADVVGEYDPATGVPFYREVFLSVERQQGKTTLEQARGTQLCAQGDRPMSWWYSAQTGKDARKKLFQDWVPIWKQSPFWRRIEQVYRARGEEGVTWVNGSYLDIMAGTEASGHGGIMDLGMIDEAFKDEDDRREQAMIPAMSTRRNAQLWVVSTVGTEKSTYLRRKFQTAKSIVLEDLGSGIAGFYFSIPEDEDIDDMRVFARYLPAFGITMDERTIAHARQSMKDAEFRRAFCNQWVEQEHDRVIPTDLWDLVCDKDVRPSGGLSASVDVLPDRSSASVAVAGRGVAELVKQGVGTGWVVPWFRHGSRDEALRQAVWHVDGTGPAAGLADDLERAGARVNRLSLADTAAACGRLYDSVADRTIRVRRSGLLDEAVAKLEKRPVGDRFVWSRSSGDATPVFALTLAWNGAAGDRVVLDGQLMA